VNERGVALVQVIKDRLCLIGERGMSDGEVPYRIAATFGLGEGSGRRSKEESSLSYIPPSVICVPVTTICSHKSAMDISWPCTDISATDTKIGPNSGPRDFEGLSELGQLCSLAEPLLSFQLCWSTRR